MSRPYNDGAEPSIKRPRVSGNADNANGFQAGYNASHVTNESNANHFFYQESMRPRLSIGPGHNRASFAGQSQQPRYNHTQGNYMSQSQPTNYQNNGQQGWQQPGIRQNSWNSSQNPGQQPYQKPNQDISHPSFNRRPQDVQHKPSIKPELEAIKEKKAESVSRPGSAASSSQPDNTIRITGTASDDPKITAMLDKSKITDKMLKYIESFKFPYNDQVGNYEKLLKIGQGTFGEVFKARCRRTGQLVALKKILMENEKEGFPITALREVKMLQRLRHANITDLKEICSERSSRDRFAFYLVFTFCDHDLAGLLSSSQIKLKLQEIKTMMKHILEGLYQIHRSNILHRDMKAANVLITHEGVLKLADFGLARLAIRTGQTTPCYTNRVVTLWYRPPELLLGTRNYGPSIDIWGAGCIMAELWTRSPILQGETEQKQLILISNLCGSINPTTWTDCDKLPYYNKMELPQNLPRRLRERLRNYLQNDQALSLVDSMLTLNPEQRPDANKALDHHFFFEKPMPLDNIRELLSRLPEGKQLFEYTAGCGAHANRGQNRNRPQQAAQHHHANRPMAPNMQHGQPRGPYPPQFRNRPPMQQRMGGPMQR